MSDQEIQPQPHQENQESRITLNIPVAASQFTGSQLTLDPVTGYLTSPQLYNGLTADKKVLAVKAAETLWPNLTAIAKCVGVNRVTLTNHMSVDDKFRHDLEAMANLNLDALESTMMEQGKQPRGYMDRITLLRAYRKERYNPESHVTITHESSITPAERAKRVSEVIDGEMIEGQKKELEGR